MQTLNTSLTRPLCLIGIIIVSIVTASPSQAANLVLSVGEFTGGLNAPKYIAYFDPATNGLTKSPAIPAAYFNEQVASMRDIVALPNGEISFVTGTGNPILVTYNQNNSSWSGSSVLPGWSIMPNGTYGGITSVGNTIYLTDMSNYPDPNRGVITTGTSIISTRILGPQNPLDVSVGNGNIYTLDGTGSPRNTVDVYNMANQSMSTIRLTEFQDFRGIVALPDSMFLATWGGDIFRMSYQGTVLDRIQVNIPRITGTNQLYNARFNDIDINANGDIALGTADGFVVMTNTSLDSYTYSKVTSGSGGDVFVCWAAVPEPSTLISTVLFGGILLARRRRR